MTLPWLDRTYMRDVAGSTLNEVCIIHSHSGSISDKAGQDQRQYTDIDNVRCGLDLVSVDRVLRAQNPTFDLDAELRIALDREFKESDEVTVLGVRYKCEGIRVGTTMKRIALKRIDVNG